MDEVKEATQLFFEHFPVVQSHLPLGYSERWAEDRLGDLRTYLSSLKAGKKGGDQQKAHGELLKGFTDEKNVKRYYQRHRGWQKFRMGAGIVAAGLALGSMGFYFHNREGKVDELEAQNGQLGQSVRELAESNTALNNLRGKLQEDRGSLASQVITLATERQALNSQYDAISSAAGQGDVAALKQAVCRYLETVNGNIVFQSTPQNSALSQLFVAMVGSSDGRDEKLYAANQAKFGDVLKPVFPAADPSGYYQFFTNDDCRKVTQ